MYLFIYIRYIIWFIWGFLNTLFLLDKNDQNMWHIFLLISLMEMKIINEKILYRIYVYFIILYRIYQYLNFLFLYSSRMSSLSVETNRSDYDQELYHRLRMNVSACWLPKNYYRRWLNVCYFLFYKGNGHRDVTWTQFGLCRSRGLVFAIACKFFCCLPYILCVKQ